MTSYTETNLWRGQHELITKIHEFLATRSLETERLRSMLILSCKADGLDQLGYGISTALRHALCTWPHDIEWRCLTRRAALSVLEKLPPLHAAKTDWIVMKYNNKQLWYSPPDQPATLYKRHAVPIFFSTIFLLVVEVENFQKEKDGFSYLLFLVSLMSLSKKLLYKENRAI